MRCSCQNSEIAQAQCLMRKYLELLQLRRFTQPDVKIEKFVFIIDVKQFIETDNDMYPNKLVNKRILNTFFKKFKDDHPDLLLDNTEYLNDAEFFNSI